MSQSLNWFLICILLVAAAAYSFVTIKSATTTPSPGSHVGTTIRAPFRHRMHTHHTVLPAVAPMWWDTLEGAYMVVLVVGAGVVELVLDSGSSQLSVKGTGCEWRSCTPLGCAITSCPCGIDSDGKPRTDCTEHYYKPSGPRLAPGERGAGLSTEMTYGSQTDTIQHYLDSVHMPVSAGALTCEQMHHAPTPAALTQVLAKDTDANVSRVRVGELVVHRVSHIDGTSSSNLLGMARPNGGNVQHGTRVVLDDLLSKSQIWSVMLHPTGGWLSLDAMPCFDTPHYIPLRIPSTFKNFLTTFYIVNVLSISVGPSFEQMTQVKNPPQYCVIDTGTTNTYGSTLLGAALDQAGYVETRSVLQLRLGSTSAPLELNYTSAQLKDPDYPDQDVIEAWAGRTLDDYSSIFPDRDGGVLLLGAVMMFGMYWEFDLNKKRIGVTDLR